MNYEFLAILFAAVSFSFGLGFVIGYKRELIPEEYPADLERSTREQERHRISRDLHDQLGQSLILLKFKLYAIKLSTPFGNQPCAELEESIAIVNSVLTELRTVVDDLHQSQNFYSDLLKLSERFSRATGIEVILPEAGSVPALSTKKSNHLLRIIQECMTNAVKHGKSPKIQIQIQQGEFLDEWCVSDYNKTPVPQGVFENPSKGKGLGFIFARAEELSGTCKFSWSEEFGTCVRVRVPRESGEQNSESHELLT